MSFLNVAGLLLHDLFCELLEHADQGLAEDWQPGQWQSGTRATPLESGA